MRVHIRTFSNVKHIEHKTQPQNRTQLTHAEQSKASKSVRDAESWLQLQRQYGNRYIQRLVQLSKERGGNGQVSTDVEQAIQGTRGVGPAQGNDHLQRIVASSERDKEASYTRLYSERDRSAYRTNKDVMKTSESCMRRQAGREMDGRNSLQLKTLVRSPKCTTIQLAHAKRRSAKRGKPQRLRIVKFEMRPTPTVVFNRPGGFREQMNFLFKEAVWKDKISHTECYSPTERKAIERRNQTLERTGNKTRFDPEVCQVWQLLNRWAFSRTVVEEPDCVSFPGPSWDLAKRYMRGGVLNRIKRLEPQLERKEKLIEESRITEQQVPKSTKDALAKLKRLIPSILHIDRNYIIAYGNLYRGDSFSVLVPDLAKMPDLGGTPISMVKKLVGLTSGKVFGKVDEFKMTFIKASQYGIEYVQYSPEVGSPALFRTIPTDFRENLINSADACRKKGDSSFWEELIRL